MTKTEWEDWKSENVDDFWALKDLAENEGCEDVFCDIVYSEEVDNMVKRCAEREGWKSVYKLIKNIVDDKDADMYRMNGEGDLYSIESWDFYADEVENNLTFDEEDEEEDDEEE